MAASLLQVASLEGMMLDIDEGRAPVFAALRAAAPKHMQIAEWSEEETVARAVIKVTFKLESKPGLNQQSSSRSQKLDCRGWSCTDARQCNVCALSISFGFVRTRQSNNVIHIYKCSWP